MTRKDLERRLHAAVSALADIKRTDEYPGASGRLSFSGCEQMVDVVGDLGRRYTQTHECSVQECVVEYSVGEADILGVKVHAYGIHRPIDVATSPTDPAPASVPKTLAGGILSDRKGAA